MNPLPSTDAINMPADFRGSLIDYERLATAFEQRSAPVSAPAPTDNGSTNEEVFVVREVGHRASSLRLIGITCIGNEADIVEAFVRHNLTLFDHLLILEHNTLDGTREILDHLIAEGLPITVEHSAEPRFLQRQFTNHLCRRAVDEFAADWVFPIDSDEFLLASSRDELDSILGEAGAAHVRLGWVNYVPQPSDDPSELHPVRRIRHYYDYPLPSVDDNPWVWKIAVNVAFLGDYYLDRYEIGQGNHFLTLLGGNQPIDAPMPPSERLRLAHFSVRSADQIGIKSAMGLLSRLGTNSKSAHFAAIWHEVTSGKVCHETMAASVRNYLDTGRASAESLRETPTRYAPLTVTEPLRYGSVRLSSISVLMKWIELNLLSEDQRRERMLLK